MKKIIVTKDGDAGLLRFVLGASLFASDSLGFMQARPLP